jgi:Sigma-70, region 4.
MKIQLRAEFQRITQDYNQALADLPRRSEIVLTLINTGMTHREVGQLLGISAGRVAQLVKEAPGYVPQRLPRDA